MQRCPRVVFVAILLGMVGCNAVPAGAVFGPPRPIGQDTGRWAVTVLKGGVFLIHVGGGIVRGLDDGDSRRDIDSGGLIAESNNLVVIGFSSSTSLWKNNGIDFARLRFDIQATRQPDGTYQGVYKLADENARLLEEDTIIMTRL